MSFRPVLILPVLFLTSCVAGRPVHYYVINRPAVAASASRTSGLVLLVGRIAAPEALQDARIRYRSGSNEVGSYEYHRWVERPAATVQDLLLVMLRASGKYKEVQESSSAATGDYLVRGRLYEFAEIDDPGIQSRVSLRLELLERKTGAVVWEHDYNRDEPVAGKTMKEVVVSMEHNLKQVLGEGTQAIEAFLSNRS